jgi:hypothetical protein
MYLSILCHLSYLCSSEFNDASEFAVQCRVRRVSARTQQNLSPMDLGSSPKDLGSSPKDSVYLVNTRTGIPSAADPNTNYEPDKLRDRCDA